MHTEKFLGDATRKCIVKIVVNKVFRVNTTLSILVVITRKSGCDDIQKMAKSFFLFPIVIPTNFTPMS